MTIYDKYASFTGDVVTTKFPDRKRKGRGRYKAVPLETDEAANLIAWKCAFMRTYPELELLFAIPNQGAAGLKRLQVEGTVRGIPDYMLAVPRGRFNGMFLELKRRKGSKPSLEQYHFLGALTAQGYYCTIAYGWDEARDRIVQYLEERLKPE